MVETLAHRIRLGEAGDCRVVLSCSEVVFVEAVGCDELLASEFVGLAGRGNAEVGDHGAVGVVCHCLLYGSRRAVDDGAVVAEVVLRVVVERHGGAADGGVAAGEEDQ